MKKRNNGFTKTLVVLLAMLVLVNAVGLTAFASESNMPPPVDPSAEAEPLEIPEEEPEPEPEPAPEPEPEPAPEIEPETEPEIVKALHTVIFMAGDAVLVTVQVEDGALIAAESFPEATVPEGQAFTGWFDAADQLYNEATPVANAADPAAALEIVLTPRFTEAEAEEEEAAEEEPEEEAPVVSRAPVQGFAAPVSYTVTFSAEGRTNPGHDPDHTAYTDPENGPGIKNTAGGTKSGNISVSSDNTLIIPSDVGTIGKIQGQNGNSTFIHWVDHEYNIYMPGQFVDLAKIAEEDESRVADRRLIVNGNLHLYAWYSAGMSDVETVTLTYHPNGGSSDAPQSFVYTKDTTVSVQNNRFTPYEGYTFLGWSLTPGGGVEYRPGDTITVSSDRTLYAVWEQDAPPPPTEVDLSTLEFEGGEKTYGEADPKDGRYTLSWPAGLNPEDFVVTITPAATGENVGEYPATATITPKDASKYTVVGGPLEAVFTITPAQLKITVTPTTSIPYGTEAPEFTRSAGEFVNGDKLEDFPSIKLPDGVPTGTPAPGEYTVTPEYDVDELSNYDVTVESAVLTVTAMELNGGLTLTANGGPYKAAPYYTELEDKTGVPDPVYTYYWRVSGTEAWIPFDAGVEPYFINAGKYDVRVELAGDGIYYTGTASGEATLEITQAALTASVASGQMKFGEGEPALTATVTGFIDGTGEGAVAAGINDKLIPGQIVSPWPLEAEIVGERPLTVTDSPYEVRVKDFDEIVVLPGAAAGPFSGDPNYYIVKEYAEGTLEVTTSGFDGTLLLTGYEGPYDRNEHEVVDAVATIDEGVEYVIEYRWKTSAGTFSAWSEQKPGPFLNAGTYTIEARARGTGNYSGEITVDAAIIITPATLTITAVADANPIYYRDAAPNYTLNYNELKGDDELADAIVTELKAEGEYAQYDDAGTYAIYIVPDEDEIVLANPADLDFHKGYPVDAASNYTLDLVPGTLTVDPMSIPWGVVGVTAEAISGSKTYGEEDKLELNRSIELPGGSKLTYTLQREPGEDVNGETGYPVTINPDSIVISDGNYTIDTASLPTGTFVINPAPLKITVANESIVYGENRPTEFTISEASYKLEDIRATVFDGPFSITVNDGGSGDPLAPKTGGYPIEISGTQVKNAAGYDNYTVAFVPGTLTVTRQPITWEQLGIDAAAISSNKIYGASDHAWFTSYTPENTAQWPDLNLRYTLTRDPGQDVNYDGYVVSLTNVSYNTDLYTLLDPPTGLYKINPAPLDLTVVDSPKGTPPVAYGNKVITYLEPVPAYELHIDGIINNDIVQDDVDDAFSTLPYADGPAAPVAAGGPYNIAINVGVLNENNTYDNANYYIRSKTPGTLTVYQMTLTEGDLALNGYSEVYDALPHGVSLASAPTGVPTTDFSYSWRLAGDEHVNDQWEAIPAGDEGKYFTNVGNYVVRVELYNPNYTGATTATAEVTITQAPLTIAALPLDPNLPGVPTVVYGDIVPLFEVAYQYFKGEDGAYNSIVSPWEIDPNFVYNANYSVDGSPYTVPLKAGELAVPRTGPTGGVPNYVVTEVPGSFIVIANDDGLPDGLVLNDYTDTYDNAAHTATLVYDATDLPEHTVLYRWQPASADAVTGEWSQWEDVNPPFLNAGNWRVQAQAVITEGNYAGSQSNIDTAFVNIAQRELHVNAAAYPGTIYYSDPAPAFDLEFDERTLAAGDTLSDAVTQESEPAFSTTYDAGDIPNRISGSAPGIYDIMIENIGYVAAPQKAGYAQDLSSNYELVPDNNNFDVLPRLAIRAELASFTLEPEDQTKRYGTPDPQGFAGKYRWLEAKGVHAQHFDISVTREPGEDVDEYVITLNIEVKDGFENLYTLIGASPKATFTITPAILTPVVENYEVPYGAPVPSLEYFYEGYAIGDDAGNVNIDYSAVPEITTTYTPTSDAGASYPITLIAGTNNNYEVLPGEGTITVVKAEGMTIVPQPRTETYQATAYPLMAASAYANGATLADAAITYAESLDGPWSDTLPERTNAGEYAFYVKAEHKNYTDVVSEAPVATLTINPYPIVLNPGDNGKAAGTSDPSPLASVKLTPNKSMTELPLPSDSNTIRRGQDYSVVREAGEEIGDYDIFTRLLNGWDKNYEFFGTTGVFTISAAAPPDGDPPVVPFAPPPAPIIPDDPIDDDPIELPEPPDPVALDDPEVPEAAPPAAPPAAPEALPDAVVPQAIISAWALLNLIIAVLCLVFGILLTATAFKRNKKRQQGEDEAADEAETDENERNPKSGLGWRILSIIAAIVAPIVFLLTENIRLPMIFTDRWTLLMVIILVVQVVGMLLLRHARNVEEKQDDDEAQANA